MEWSPLTVEIFPSDDRGRGVCTQECTACPATMKVNEPLHYSDSLIENLHSLASRLLSWEVQADSVFVHGPQNLRANELERLPLERLRPKHIRFGIGAVPSDSEVRRQILARASAAVSALDPSTKFGIGVVPKIRDNGKIDNLGDIKSFLSELVRSNPFEGRTVFSLENNSAAHLHLDDPEVSRVLTEDHEELAQGLLDTEVGRTVFRSDIWYASVSGVYPSGKSIQIQRRILSMDPHVKHFQPWPEGHLGLSFFPNDVWVNHNMVYVRDSTVRLTYEDFAKALSEIKDKEDLPEILRCVIDYYREDKEKSGWRY